MQRKPRDLLKKPLEELRQHLMRLSTSSNWHCRFKKMLRMLWIKQDKQKSKPEQVL